MSGAEQAGAEQAGAEQPAAIVFEIGVPYDFKGKVIETFKHAGTRIAVLVVDIKHCMKMVAVVQMLSESTICILHHVNAMVDLAQKVTTGFSADCSLLYVQIGELVTIYDSSSPNARIMSVVGCDGSKPIANITRNEKGQILLD